MNALQDRTVPLVSVIVRTQNRPLLLQAISSLLTQTYPHLEVIVVNDGGEDVSTVIAPFSNYLNITYRTHATSRGGVAAANTGLAVARGKYVNLMDDADLLYPEHVEKLALFLETTGEQVAYSDCTQSEYRWEGTDFVLDQQKTVFRGVDFDRDRLHCENYLAGLSILFARALWERIGLLGDSPTGFEDWDFWQRLAEHAPFHRLPGVTAEYRHFAPRERLDLPTLTKRHDKDYRYWTMDNPARRIWSRIDALETENQRLRAALARMPEEVRRTEKHPRPSSSARLLSFIKRLIHFLLTACCFTCIRIGFE
ncbi:MAG: glycosyltransferase [Candidatus Competibacteraceae bacterium]